MANAMLNSDLILNEIAYEFANDCKALDMVDRQFDGKFEQDRAEFAKTGGTIKVRKPPIYLIRSGEVSGAGQALRESISISTETLFGVDLPSFTLTEKSVKEGEYEQKQDIKAAGQALAAYVDKRILQEVKNISNSIHSSANSITYDDVLNAKALIGMQAGGEDISGFLSSPDEVSLVSGNKTYVNPSAEIGKQYKTGKIGIIGGVDFSRDDKVFTLTTGSRVGTILIDEQSGTNLVEGTTTLHIDGLTNATDTANLGEVFTVAGVYAVHPITKETLPVLKQFVVSEDFIAASNKGDIKFVEAIYASSTDPRKNVSALPEDGAAVTFLGTASKSIVQNLIMNPTAITLASVKLKKFQGIHESLQSTKVIKNISLSLTPVTDAKTFSEYLRVDCVIACKSLAPMHAARIWGKEV